MSRKTLEQWIERTGLATAKRTWGLAWVAASPVFRLLFNLTSLQCYEIGLIVAAVFLARRAAHEDAILLVVIESLLVFVPFILLNGALFVSPRFVWGTCMVALLATLFIDHRHLGDRALSACQANRAPRPPGRDGSSHNYRSVCPPRRGNVALVAEGRSIKAFRCSSQGPS